jgi:hypothetical protein
VGTLIFFGVIVLGVFLGIVLIALLSMAKRTDQIYERIVSGEECAIPADPLYRRAAENQPETRGGEARPQRDLRPSVAAQ